MKQYIRHRANSLEDLEHIDPSWGVEIDLRSDVHTKGSLLLAHDPWSCQAPFEEWLRKYRDLKISGPLILNTKEDGLESRILELMAQYEVPQFFFLDTSLPTLVRWAVREKKSFFAVRYSHYEPKELCSRFAGLVDWLWVDCFDVQPENASEVERVAKDGGFKVCLVSPELQGGSTQAFDHFRDLFLISDAICTKHVSIWMNLQQQNSGGPN